MDCKNCGANNTDDAKYCSSCGSLVDEALSSEKKKELAKTLVFLVTTLVILFVVIYRIQSDFDNFISYDLPLNLTVEDSRDKLIGDWYSTEETSVFSEASFTKHNFKLDYNHEVKSLAGIYYVNDPNTITLNVLLINEESMGSPMDVQYKFHFQGDDTLVIVFNGISNVFERK